MVEISEEAIACVVDCLCNHPRHRELLYKTVSYCTEERTAQEAEDFIEGQPEYGSALQTSTTLLRILEEKGAVALASYDADGAVIDDARAAELQAQGLDEDGLADLVAERRVRTTAAGEAALVLLDPERRIAACAHAVPERSEAFVKLLDFCRDPRSLDEVKGLFADDPVLDSGARTAGQRLHAVYFIDRLNEAGGLVWDGAWVTTDAGKRFLASV